VPLIQDRQSNGADAGEWVNLNEAELLANRLRKAGGMLDKIATSHMFGSKLLLLA
jgi:hypothetical protein